jgi:carboxylate-amine ligase
MKDVWWDLRPSPQHGTLELRFCDQPATLREALGIVAFVHGLAHWFAEHEEEWNHSHTPLKQWIFRENKWRAIRYGLHAQIVTARNGKTKTLYKDVLEWIKVIHPYTKQLKYDEHISMIREIIEKGNSAERQYKVFEATRDLKNVVRHNVEEFESGVPQWKA